MSPDNRFCASCHPSLPSSQVQLPAPAFGHLRWMTDPQGLWEHARMSAPRVDHGFCTDDNGRALVVVSRQTPRRDHLTDLAATYLRFVLESRTVSGRFRNRRSADGLWSDDIGSDDSQGRAWWGLGTVARLGPSAWMRRAGSDAFDTSASFQSPHLRANAYAALGASEMLVAEPGNRAALAMLERTSGTIADAARGRVPWPEIRLTYDNPRLPEALLAAGTALDDPRLVSTGMRLLEWLIRVETNGDHFSFTPSTGWALGEPRPAFDQQPIEAWAMADACYRAWGVTGDDAWRTRTIAAAQWLTGRNDNSSILYDQRTGGTCDGLTEGSVNENRGAESTLAGIGALQLAAMCTTSSCRATTR